MNKRTGSSGIGKLTSLYKKSPKYFKKLFFIYFALTIIIFSIVSGFVTVYKKSDDGYDAFVDKTMQTEKFKTDTDIIFDTADVIVNLLSEYDITKRYSAAKTDVYSQLDFGLILDIVKNISQMQTRFAGYNLNIAMTKYTDNRVFTGNRATETIDSFLKESGIDIHSAVYQIENAEEKAKYKIIASDSVTDKITVIHKRIISGNAMYYILFFGNDDMKYVYDSQVDMHFIYSNYNEKYKNVVKNQILENGDIKVMGYTTPTKNVSSFYCKSGADSERIVYVKNFIDKKTPYIIFMIPWIVILTGLAVFIALMLAKYSYIPMHNVLERFGVIGGDNMDEFAAMEEMVDSMMEKNRTMHMSIVQKDRVLKNRFMFDVLNGYIWGDKLSSLAEDNGVAFIQSPCWLVLMEIDSVAMEDNFVLDSIAGTDAKIFTVTEEHFSDYTDTVLCAAMDRRMALLCAKDKNNLSDILTEIDAIRYETGLGINIAVGESDSGDEGVAKIYRVLARGLDNKSLTSKKDIITEEDIGALTNSKLVYSAETEAMLTDYVVSGEKAKALYCINNIFKSNQEAPGEQLEDFKLTMIITVKRILVKLDAVESDVFGQQIDVSGEIKNTKSVNELFEVIKDIFGMISDYVLESIDSSTLTIGSEILEYINENLGSDISIGDVSEHFGISPSSIGRILRMQYNVTFKTYINDARIKKAKQIMDNDKNILIKDLAQMCGYNNAVSFIRMFKKSEGVSPGQYIRMR